MRSAAQLRSYTLVCMIGLLALFAVRVSNAGWTRTLTQLESTFSVSPDPPTGFVISGLCESGPCVIQLSPGGRVLWARTIAASSGSLQRLHLAGLTGGGAIVTATLVSGAQPYRAVFFRLSGEGELERAWQVSAASGRSASAVTVRADGTIIATGTAGDTPNKDETTWVVAFDGEGAPLWEGAYDDPRSEGRYLLTASNGDIIVAGVHLYLPGFGHCLTEEAYVMRLGPDGALRWQVACPAPDSFGDYHDEVHPTGLAESPTGEIMLAGTADRPCTSQAWGVFASISADGTVGPVTALGKTDITGIVSRAGDDLPPVAYGVHSFQDHTGWIWNDPGGTPSWRWTLLAPSQTPDIDTGCPAPGGGLFFAGRGTIDGRTQAVLWRTGAGGLIQGCSSQQPIDITQSASSIPLKATWNPQTTSIASTVSRVTLTVSPATTTSSLICGTASDAPGVPALTIFGAALLALILTGAAVTRFRLR